MNVLVYCRADLDFFSMLELSPPVYLVWVPHLGNQQSLQSFALLGVETNLETKQACNPRSKACYQHKVLV